MPKPFRSLPPLIFLRDSLIYEPELGAYRWQRWRPREHFPTQKGWKTFNRLFGGTPAGGIVLGYWMIHISGKNYRAARIAWMLMTGEDPGAIEIDHINKNSADDRWENLRLATSAQNLRNRGVNKNNGSGLKGAYRHRKQWHSQITAEGVVHYLGSFPTPEAAHAAYVEAARRLHGDFAREG